ncbi:hypothetical protein LTR28_006568 [Elasticomyces elasticus]|nr:hypothetical protein LTR28_006568 [Elasticomyces elasticus]
MSTLEDLDDLERDGKKDDGDKDQKKPNENGDAEMKDAEGGNKEERKEEDAIDMEVLNSSTRDIIARRRLLENDTRIMRSEFQRLTHEKQTMHDKIKDNVDKIDNNRCAIPLPSSEVAQRVMLRPRAG